MDDPEDTNSSKNTSLNLIADYGTDSDSEDTETRSNTGNEDSDGVEHHEMVLKNNIINACAHGPLSKSSNENSDVEVTRHMIIDSVESGVVEYEVSEYRDADFDSDSSSDPSISSDSDVESVKDVEEASSGVKKLKRDENEPSRTAKPEPVKCPGELGLDDLPPIEDLAISLPEQQTTKIGTIASIVDRLVIVRAIPDLLAVDLDTVLFLENGAKALGKVFDVFGPVTEPHYCVRFNSAEHVRERGAAPGADVFVAPLTPHTSYVFLNDLIKVKGSDASWLNDVEPPPNQLDYSDDEEKKANRMKKEYNIGEKSRNPCFRKMLEAKRNQRPSESSSRFGGGPSRGRSPFGGFRRTPGAFPRFVRPWMSNVAVRTPMLHPADPTGFPFAATPPPFNPSVLPPNFCVPPPPPPPSSPYVGGQFQFGMGPRLGPQLGAPLPVLPVSVAPAFGPGVGGVGGMGGVAFCSVAPQWVRAPPPPSGT